MKLICQLFEEYSILTIAYSNKEQKFSITLHSNHCHLTNRFHFAVRLFSYRSQMTSKCGKNKKVAHEPLGEWVTDVLTTF